MTTTEERSVDTPALTPELRWLAVVVVLGSVLTILDATVVNVALPVLGRELGATVATVQWVATAYLLAFASVIPMTGWATDRFGARRVWLFAIALFLAGSLLCAMATSVPTLLAARVLQGLGGGLVVPVGQAMLARVAGRERMGRVMTVVGVPMLLAPIAGPVVGGALLDAAGWRWIFLLTLPVGAVALALAVRRLPPSVVRPGVVLDRIGVLLLPPALALSVYGLVEAAAGGTVSAVRPAVALLLGSGLAVAYVRHALRTPEPLLDVRLFARRGFGSAAAASFV